MKRLVFCTALLLALLPASACGKPADRSQSGSQPAGASSQPGKIVFTDALGQEFAVERPERVVVTIGSFADVWLLAGGEDSLAATANDAWESYGLDLGETENIGSPMKPSGELILAARPDLIIASSLSPSNLELRETFERAGIPAAYFDVASFEDYLDLLDLFTQLTGCPENFTEYGTRVKEQVEEARALSAQSVEAPVVLVLQVSGSSVKVKSSRDNVLGEMLSDLGCVNLADREGALLEDLSLEAVIQGDPDFIFAVYHGTDEAGAQANLEASLLSNPAWGNLRAVREGRFYTLDRRRFNLKPNALWGEAYEQLSDILYGE